MFEDIYQEYVQEIHRRVKRKVPEIDVDDVVQEIWVVVSKGIVNIREKSFLRTWIHSIATNTIANYYRQRSKQENACEKELKRRLTRNEIYVECPDDLFPYLMPILPTSYAEIIQKVYVEGFTFKEIASQEHKKYETIRSCHRRAIDYIRDHDLAAAFE